MFSHLNSNKCKEIAVLSATARRWQDRRQRHVDSSRYTSRTLSDISAVRRNLKRARAVWGQLQTVIA